MKAELRRKLILEAFTQGPQSIPSLSKLTQVSKSGCFTTVAALLVDGLIEFVGTQKSSSPWGGQPMRVFRLVGTQTEPPPATTPSIVTRIENAARTYWKPQRPRTKSRQRTDSRADNHTGLSLGIYILNSLELK